jgi:hypothetical protein
LKRDRSVLLKLSGHYCQSCGQHHPADCTFWFLCCKNKTCLQSFFSILLLFLFCKCSTTYFYSGFRNVCFLFF